MSLKKLLLSASLIPILLLGSPSKSKANKKFTFWITAKPVNSTQEYQIEVEEVSKDTYKICATVEFNGKTENLGCIYKKAIDTTNSTTLYHKPQKHYNWIKPDKYDNWQCAYELVYPNNDKNRIPDGFKLYVDTDGDGKTRLSIRVLFRQLWRFF